MNSLVKNHIGGLCQIKYPPEEINNPPPSLSLTGQKIFILRLLPALKKWSPTGESPWPLHMLQRAEPSEAYPTTLLQSFEGYPLRIHPRSERPWLSALEGKGVKSALSSCKGSDWCCDELRGLRLTTCLSSGLEYPTGLPLKHDLFGRERGKTRLDPFQLSSFFLGRTTAG